LTQETFVKAFRSLHRYNASLAFAPWLFAIARRTAASHFRSAKHFEQLPADREAPEENPATALEQSDEQQSLWKLVRTLKPKQAEAVWLRYAEGFSVAETARVMGTNQVHVKVLLHRARSNLSKILNARGMAPTNTKNSFGPDRTAASLAVKAKGVL
jgi:RNA polymerase sigma-70 factor (ECF subfamily)